MNLIKCRGSGVRFFFIPLFLLPRLHKQDLGSILKQQPLPTPEKLNQVILIG